MSNYIFIVTYKGHMAQYAKQNKKTFLYKNVKSKKFCYHIHILRHEHTGAYFVLLSLTQ